MSDKNMATITQRRLDALRSDYCKLKAQRDELLAACKAWEYARTEGGISMVDWFEVAWEKTTKAIANAEKAT